MADGSAKAIASVQPGDWVKSRNEATGQDEARQVTASVKRLSPAVVTVALADSKTGKIETLSCTPEHPLFVQGQGWVEAGSVGIGTSIVSRAGLALEVTSLTWEKNRAEELAAGTGSSFGGYTVYNLTVEGDHTYFVGASGGGTWVHNAGPCDWKPAEEAGTKASDSADAFQRDLIKKAEKLSTVIRVDIPIKEDLFVAGKLPHVEGDGWSVNIDGSWHDPGTKTYAIPSTAVKQLKGIGWPLPEGY